MRYNNGPRVSVAMAVFNGEAYLSQQLDSILRQTYTNIEIIICDDCSTDNTIKILNQYQMKYTSIKIFQNSVRLGFIKNFEKAITLCTSDYIALSDQDDIWSAEKLQTSMEAMINKENELQNSPIMIHTDLSVIDERNNKVHNSYFYLKQYKLKAKKDLGHIVGHCGVMGNTVLFNKNLKDKILPFPESLEFHDYWIALVNELLGYRITIKKPLTHYRVHTSNTSNTKTKLETLSLSLSNFFQKNYIPAFLHTQREDIIKEVILRFKLQKKDITLLTYFLKYLNQEGSKMKHLYHLFKYSIVKRNISYRIFFIIKYIFFKNGTKQP